MIHTLDSFRGFSCLFLQITSCVRTCPESAYNNVQCLSSQEWPCLLVVLVVVDTVEALPWFFEAICSLLQLCYFLWIRVLASWNLCHLRSLARCILGIAVSCSYCCGFATAGLGLGQEYSIRDGTVELISHVALPWREFIQTWDHMKAHFDFHERLNETQILRDLDKKT